MDLCEVYSLPRVSLEAAKFGEAHFRGTVLKGSAGKGFGLIVCEDKKLGGVKLKRIASTEGLSDVTCVFQGDGVSRALPASFLTFCAGDRIVRVGDDAARRRLQAGQPARGARAREPPHPRPRGPAAQGGRRRRQRRRRRKSRVRNTMRRIGKTVAPCNNYSSLRRRLPYCSSGTTAFSSWRWACREPARRGAPRGAGAT